MELKDIREIRKKLNLTQTQLARVADVSQSLIAKIESGRIDPTYAKTKRIFDALDDLANKKDTKISEVMQKKIISVKPEGTVKEAIKKIRKYSISQLPVIEKDNIIGLVTESSILNATMDKGINKLSIKDIMEDSPPVVSKNASLKLASSLLKFFPIVIVAQSGKIVGLVTKADVLKAY